MDVHSLVTNAAYVSSAGQFLSTEERVLVASSLTLLQSNSASYAVRLFGKINGIERDYLVALGYDAVNQAYPSRAWFTASDTAAEWALLPVLSEADKHHARKIRGPLLGKPDFVYTVEDDITPPPVPAPRTVNEDGSEEPAAEAGEGGDGAGAGGVPSAKVPELNRLSLAVESLLRECLVVPRGAFVLNSLQEVVANKLFVGLTSEDAGKLLSYLHACADADKMGSLLEQHHLDKSIDFLPSIADDIPRGSWSIVRDSISGAVVLRSLLWPGFVAYHVPQSSIFGSFYAGNGLKNLDIGFML
eukprot:ANDGO_02992.mRNA.1 hypothetical protein PTSG_01527